MGETGQAFDFNFREGKPSDPIQFYSGHETDVVSPLPPSPRNPGSHSDRTADKREKIDKRKLSPKPSKRTRKISLFSQLHFNARFDDKHGKSRKVSAPTISSLVPCSTLPLTGYSTEDILPDLSSDSSTSSVQSSTSLPCQLAVDNSMMYARRKSSGTCNMAGNEKETASVKDIIYETLSLQFENVTEYKREVCDKLGKNVSELVRRRVEIMKEALGQPCKIVTLVYVGAIRDSGIDVATRAVLDNDKDIFTAACYRNGHVFAMAAAMVVALDSWS